ncbi:MAG: HAD-IIA family hydrolase [Candidatus Nanopelagicales bacterium]|nr:HAD-IIA family hydrolase [Candidatus Nanopelagicales bacterium]
MTIGAHDVLLFDLDGVVYIGAAAVPGAVEAIESATAQGARCIFVTNNASRTPAQVALHLRDLGIPAHDDDVITSSMAGATLVAEHISGGNVLAIGGPGVGAALSERGFTPVSTFGPDVAALMQGYGPAVGWADLAEATYAVRAGVPWIATNLDATFPSPRGIAPGNGALVDVVARTAGRRPDAVAGKPEPALLLEAIRRTGATAPLMIGDRLDTDIAAGSRLGIPTLLVCTGVASRLDGLAASGEERPTYLADDLACLLPNEAWVAVA